jgi:hypothetical protein
MSPLLLWHNELRCIFWQKKPKQTHFGNWRLCILFSLYTCYIAGLLLCAYAGPTVGVETAMLHKYMVQSAVWIGWLFSAIYTVCMVLKEAKQIKKSNLSYFNEFYNLLDIVGCLSTACSLSFMLALSINRGSAEEAPWLDPVQAIAGLARGCGIIKFFCGLELTAFLVYMLEAIIKDCVDFMVLLATVLASFGYAFHLLLKHVILTEDQPSEFAQVPESLTTVYEMMNGAFDIAYFRQSHFWYIAVPLFVIFMLVVPTVMLNALIAIMGDTFEKVQQNKVAAGRIEFARIILELEEEGEQKPHRDSAEYVPDAARPGKSSYLHVLAARSNLASGGEWQGRSRTMLSKFETIECSLGGLGQEVAAMEKGVHSLVGESGLNVDALGEHS